jgi:hypothetical protein
MFGAGRSMDATGLFLCRSGKQSDPYRREVVAAWQRVTSLPPQQNDLAPPKMFKSPDGNKHMRQVFATAKYLARPTGFEPVTTSLEG